MMISGAKDQKPGASEPFDPNIGWYDRERIEYRK